MLCSLTRRFALFPAIPRRLSPHRSLPLFVPFLSSFPSPFISAMSTTTSPPPSSSSSAPTLLPAQLTTMCMANTQFQAFQGNPLNKLHLHRKDEAHIASRITHSNARFLLLNQRFQPLLRTLPLIPPPPSSPTTYAARTLPPVVHPLTRRAVICWFTLPQLQSLGLHLDTTPSPLCLLLGQVDNEAPIAKTVTVGGEVVESGDPPPPTRPSSLLSNDGSLEEDSPYHSVLLPDSLKSHVLSSLPSLDSTSASYDFHDLRTVLPLLNYTDASILAQARALTEWHQSSLHCGKCGAPTLSFEGGGKRVCTSPPPPPRTDAPGSFMPPSSNPGTAPGSSPTYCGRTLYPRTDCVTITLVVSADGERALLGRKKEFPVGIYTCLAGFMEGGETPEEGARREVWEETGVVIGPVRYFASQPWPFLGGQLMMGFFGEADAAGEEVKLLDGELEEAKWFSRSEVGEMLTVTRARPEGWARPEAFAGARRVPPCYAIAHQLIAHWYLFGGTAEASEQEALKERGVKHQNTNLLAKWIAHL